MTTLKSGQNNQSRGPVDAPIQPKPLIESIQTPKIAHGTIVDLGKGPVLAIENPKKKGTFYLIPYQTCNIALSQMRSERSEEFDFLDIVQDFVTYKYGQSIRSLKCFTELQAEGLLSAFAEIMAQYVQETQKIVAAAKRNYVRMPPSLKRIVNRFDALEVFEAPAQESGTAEKNALDAGHSEPATGNQEPEAQGPKSETEPVSAPSSCKASKDEIADAIYEILKAEPGKRNSLMSIIAQRFPANSFSSKNYVNTLVFRAYKRHVDLGDIPGVQSASMEDLAHTVNDLLTQDRTMKNNDLIPKLKEKYPNNRLSTQGMSRIVSLAYRLHPGLRESRTSKASKSELTDSLYSLMIANSTMCYSGFAAELRRFYPRNSISESWVGALAEAVLDQHPELRAQRQKEHPWRRTASQEQPREDAPAPVEVVLATINEVARAESGLLNERLAAKLQERHPHNSFSDIQYVRTLVSMAYKKYPDLKGLRMAARNKGVSGE